MANKLRDEDLNLNIIVNGDKGKKELGDLEKATRDLTNRNKELRTEKEKLTRAGKQETEEYKAIEKQLRENNKAIKTNETRMTELRKEIGLTGLTMRQLRSEQVRLKRLMDSATPGTEQWKKYNAELLKVEAQIGKVSAGAKASQFSMGKMADGFNRYFSMITVWVASVTGIIFGFKKAASAYAEFTDQVADVQKTTNLSKDEIIELDEALQKINTRSSQEQLLGLARIAGKLGKDSTEDVLGFVRAADKINVALNEDLGGDIEETVRKLGKLTEIFNLEQQFGTEQALLKVGSAINSLGAASTANEGYLVEFTSRMAGIAPAAGITAPQVLGLASTLDQLAQTSEISSTVFAQVIPNMFKDTATFASVAGMSVADFTNLLNTDANEALLRLLEGLSGNNEGMGQMIKKLDALGIDGVRGTNVLLRLAQSTQMLREQQQLANEEFEKGTSLTVEFNIKNNTAQAGLEKSRKNLALITRELGQNLSPAVLFSTNGITYFIKAMVALIRFTREYYPLILGTTAAVAAYTIVVNAQNIATKLYNAATAVATFVTKAFNTAVKSNPLGILISLLAGAAVGLAAYARKINTVTAEQQALNDVEKTAQQNIVEQKTNVELLMAAAKNENRTLAERKKALEELNKISPEFYGNLTLEKINSQEATEATKAYTEALLEQARVQAAKEKLIELEKERIDAIQSGSDYQSKWYQTAWNGVKSFGNAATFAYNQAITGAKNATAADAEYMKQKEALIGIIGKQKKSTPVISGMPGSDGGEGGTVPETGEETPTKTPFTITQETDAPISNFALDKAKQEAQILAEKKASEAEWTAFLKKQIDERLEAGKQELAEEEKNLEFEKQITEARQQLKSEYMNAIGQVAGALASMFEEGSAAQIAALAIEKAAAIAQVIFQTAVANAKAVAMSPLTAGQPWVTINTVSAAASIAAMAATTISSFKDKKNNNKPGYASGKYPGLQTGFYGEKPHYALFNEVPGQPEMVVDGLTTRRLQFNYPEIIKAIYAVRDGRQPGYASGKYPSSPSPLPSSAGGGSYGLDSKTITDLTTAINQFLQHKPPVYLEEFEKKWNAYNDIKTKRNL
jgi:TP901 family phage tail tape measure protein